MKTIIAAFQDLGPAQHAMDELDSADVKAESVRLITAPSEGQGIIDTLTSRKVPRDRAELYGESVRRGSPLVLVEASNDDVRRIAAILDACGSLDMETAGKRWRADGWQGYRANAMPYDDTERATERGHIVRESLQRENLERGDLDDGNLDGRNLDGAELERGNLEHEALPVIEEEVRVGKRQVESERLRVRTFITERPVHEEVELREEHINVTREPVDEPIAASAADTTFKEEEFVVTATSEEPVVEKQARVVERVSVNKAAATRTETIEDTERRQEVEVEPAEKLGRTEPRRH